MKQTILIVVIAATISFFVTEVNAGSSTLDLNPSITLLDNSPEIVISSESNLDKLKRWNKILRGKEPIHTTTGGIRTSIDVSGSEKSVMFSKTF